MENNALTSNLVAKHPMGIRLLSTEEIAVTDLGPLTQLQGTWTGKPDNGWNVISVPGPNQVPAPAPTPGAPAIPVPEVQTDGFILEVIPYEETLTFSPVVLATNRGPFINGVEQNQELAGLMYEQIITSTCTTDFCHKRGFDSGNIIHAETGFLLYIRNLNSNFDIVRLSNIPHGNSLLALGESSTVMPPDNKFFGEASTIPTGLNGQPLLDYGITQFDTPQFSDFDQKDPNTFLSATLGADQLTALTTLTFSTKNQDGGVLSIPFIQQNIKTTDVEATFWIETIANGVAGTETLQLQYSQTINLVFPPTGSTAPVIWPHVTVNTLQKTS